jgi:hypothetical protein
MRVAFEATPETFLHFEQWHIPSSVVLPSISNCTALHRHDPRVIAMPPQFVLRRLTDGRSLAAARADYHEAQKQKRLIA